MRSASLSPRFADLFRRYFVINTSPSVLINDPLKDLWAVAFMTKGALWKTKLQEWQMFTREPHLGED